MANQAVPAAQDGESARKQQAKDMVEAAKAQGTAGNFRAALELYLKAYETFPSPFLQWYLADMYLATDQPVEGLDSLRRYREGISEADRPEGQREGEIQALEERLRARLAFLKIEAGEPGARVLVDGKEAQRSSLGPVQLNPGTHVVQGRGNHTIEKTVELKAGETRLVRLDVPPEPRPVPAIQRSMATGTQPIEAGSKRNRLLRVLGVGAASASVALLAGSAIALGVREQQIGTWNDDTNCLTDGLSRAENCSAHLSAGNAAESAAIATLVIGGALSATAAALLVLGRPERSRPNRLARWTCGSFGQVGIHCAGTF